MTTENIDGYDKSAKAFADKIGSLSNYNEAYDNFLQYINDGDSVLDLACGPANISRYLLDKKPNLKITGIDLAPKMLELARQKIPSGNFILSDITDFFIPDDIDNNSSKPQKFDAAINGFGLPYLNEAEITQSFTQTAHHLKKGGVFYVSFMNGDKVQKEHPSFNTEITLTVTYHPQKKIEAMLEKIGFTILNRYNLDYKEADGSSTTDVVLISQY